MTNLTRPTSQELLEALAHTLPVLDGAHADAIQKAKEAPTKDRWERWTEVAHSFQLQAIHVRDLLKRASVFPDPTQRLLQALKVIADVGGFTNAGVTRDVGKCSQCGGMTPSGGLTWCRKCVGNLFREVLSEVEGTKP